MPSAAINYLGYERRTDDTTIAHLKKRTTQANKASLNVRTILKRLPNLPIKRQLHIANACIRTVFLYGTEACLDEAIEELKHEMNVIMRKTARQILRTSYAPAN